MSLHDTGRNDEIERVYAVMLVDCQDESGAYGTPIPNPDELWMRAYDRVVNEAIGSWEWRG